MTEELDERIKQDFSVLNLYRQQYEMKIDDANTSCISSEYQNFLYKIEHAINTNLKKYQELLSIAQFDEIMKLRGSGTLSDDEYKLELSELKLNRESFFRGIE